MKYLPILFLWLVAGLPYSGFSQGYSYIHYDITQGLASSTVYCITQDKEGFLWMGTETGVSRFDGTHFRNFTRADGLPDLEVLQIFADSKGRVWMAPFRKAICYYAQGRIHNQENDTVLRRIRLKGIVENFAEDRYGNILVQEKTCLHLFRSDGQVEQYDSINGQPMLGSSSICQSVSGDFLVQDGDQIYSFSGSRFTGVVSQHLPYDSPNCNLLTSRFLAVKDSAGTEVRSLETGKISFIQYQRYKHISYCAGGDSLLYLCGSSGVMEYNIHTGERKYFLPDTEVDRCYRDHEGNIWFATAGLGLYLLNSELIRNVDLHTSRHERCPVYAVTRYKNILLAGSNHHILFSMTLPELKDQQAHDVSSLDHDRITYLEDGPDGHVVMGTDMGMEKYTRGHIRGKVVGMDRQCGGIKGYSTKNARELFLATNEGIFVFDREKFRIIDTMWRGRATATFYSGDSLFVGTLDGLYLVRQDKSTVFLGDQVPFLRQRIASIAGSRDGTLWVASYDFLGIAAIRKGKLAGMLTEQQGLTSNFCRLLAVHNGCLWAGTDKGLDKIDLTRAGFPITRYTSAEGLGSDIINALYFDSSMVYVGTPAGLSYFNESWASTSVPCRLSLLALINSDSNRIADTAGLVLRYNKNNIRFEYAGISYKSVGNISYRYRLLGLDSNWKNTLETFLDYPSLPSGNYVFQLRAFNKFGAGSPPLSLSFEVSTPFWRTIWFTGLLLALFLGLTWLMVTVRFKLLRRRQEERHRLDKRLVDLEHMALKAQMNPHFIFNCLNSIQDYIFDQDIVSANRYISGFAKLIRATLHHSSLSYISLRDEIDYLSIYLSLEKLRFSDKMEYRIEVDPELSGREIYIPSMLIQPYVENCMRHGLRHKMEGQGHILISARREEDKVVFVIEDNGIGRKRAAQLKTREHIEYQSKGMSLTADRIKLLNTAYGDSIQTEIIDLEDEEGNAKGTRVTIQFSEFLSNNLTIPTA